MVDRRKPHQLFADNQGLAKTIALDVWRNAPPGYCSDDLVQEALLGLLDATHWYRAGRGDFCQYATVAIRNRCRRFLSIKRWKPLAQDVSQIDEEEN